MPERNKTRAILYALLAAVFYFHSYRVIVHLSTKTGHENEKIGR